MGGSGGMVPRPELPRADSMAAAGPPDGSRASRGMVPRVALGALTFLFPFAVLLAVWAAVKGGFGLPDSTLTGVRTVPPILSHAVATMGGGRGRVIRDVYLPGALPSIVVGCRLGVGYGWRALIAGDMLTGKAGLGFLIFDARRFDRIDRIIAGLLVIGTLYLIIDRLLLAPVEEATAQRWGSVR